MYHKKIINSLIISELYTTFVDIKLKATSKKIQELLCQL